MLAMSHCTVLVHALAYCIVHLQRAYLARGKVHLHVLGRGTRMMHGWGLLLVGLLALMPRIHSVLGLLVEWVGWGRLPWHSIGIQSNPLQNHREAVDINRLTGGAELSPCPRDVSSYISGAVKL